jgi:hypothetical protein
MVTPTAGKQDFILSPTIVDTYRNCEAKNAHALCDIIRALCLSHETLREKLGPRMLMKRDDCFSDQWLASKFLVAFSGEGAMSFMADTFEEAIGIVMRETLWDEFAPFETDSWTHDDSGFPFMFRCEVGECSSLTITRITERP